MTFAIIFFGIFTAIGLALVLLFSKKKSNKTIQNTTTEELVFFQKWQEKLNSMMSGTIIVKQNISVKFQQTKLKSEFNKLMQNKESNLSQMSVDEWIVMLDDYENVNQERLKTWIPHLRGVINRSSYIVQEKTSFCHQCFVKIVKHERHTLKWQSCPICHKNNFFVAEELIGVIAEEPLKIAENQVYVSIWNFETNEPRSMETKLLKISEHENAEWFVHAWLEKMMNESTINLQNLKIQTQVEFSENLKRIIQDMNIILKKT